jgi:uncharacterized oxidoreductase
MVAFNVEAFRPLDEFKREVADFAAYLKSSPPADGFTEVYYPGELEYLRTQKLLVEGVYVEDSTWAKLGELAVGYGMAGELGLG